MKNNKGKTVIATIMIILKIDRKLPGRKRKDSSTTTITSIKDKAIRMN